MPEDYEVRTTMLSSVYGIDDSNRYVYDLCMDSETGWGTGRKDVSHFECKLRSCYVQHRLLGERPRVVMRFGDLQGEPANHTRVSLTTPIVINHYQVKMDD